MPRTVIVPDVKQLTDHYLRQQRGGNIAGFRGARMQRGYGIGGTNTRDAGKMKGQRGQLFNKGHFFNKYIFPTYNSSEYIYAR